MDQAGATKDATTQDIANLAPGTDLSYTAGTRQLSSSTGQDVTLPLAGTDPGLLAGVSFTGPNGWSASGSISSGSITLSLGLPAGYGLISTADQSKLTGIANGATANATDAQLRDRSTHTGTQAASTITGLATVATSGAYADLSGRPTLGTSAALDAAAAGDATSGQVVKGSDSRLSDARTPTAHTQAASTISDSTAAGRALLTAADAAAQRTSLGLGTAATANTGTSAGNVVALDNAGKLPAVDGSQLTNLPAGSGTVSSVALSAPTGFSVSGSPVTTTGTLSLTFAAGYSLPTTSSQGNWDTAYTDRLKWDGGATGLNASTARTSLGLGTAATTDASAYATAAQGSKADTAVQPGSLATVATSGSYADLSSKPTIPSLSDATPQSPGTAAAGTASSAARGDHVHPLPTTTAIGAAASGAIGSSGLTMATARLLGRSTASTGAVEEMTLPPGFDLSAGAMRAPAEIGLACSDETTALTAGNGKVTFKMPYAMTLTAVRASVTTAPTGSTLVVDINEGGVSILSTKLSIDATEKTSTTAATAAVISDASLADDAEITIDIDQIGSTVAGAGLKVWLIGRRA